MQDKDTSRNFELEKQYVMEGIRMRLSILIVLFIIKLIFDFLMSI